MNEPPNNADSQAKTRLNAGSDAASTEDVGEILDADGLPPPIKDAQLEVGSSIGHPSIYSTIGVSPANGATLVELGPATPSTEHESNAATRMVSPHLAEGARYDLLNEIGRGGMGVVFKAFDKDLRRNVALKISRASSQTGRSHGRFIEEAQVQGQLSHPNIVPVHELGVDPRGRPYFTMKLVEGRSLASVIRDLRKGDAKARADWPLSKRLYIFGQLLNCVAYAHARGVIHRDLKPDNLMLGDFGEVLLMDWGLARVLSKPEGESGLKVDTSRLQTPGDQTLDGQIVGTPAYMPPEQARGERDKIDERSDIYSLGAILYELLCLEPPYAAKTASDLLSKVMSERPLPPSQKNKAAVIPRGLEAICMKCLEAERENRYQSVRELQGALDEWVRKLAESSSEGVGFALLGKLAVVSAVTSVFLLTSLFISGAEKIDFETYLINPGIFAAFMTLGFGSIIEWLTLGMRHAFDGTQAVLFWSRAGVEGDHLRGYFAVEACRRAKWVYLFPCLGAVIVAAITRNHTAAMVAVQMFGAGLMCLLGVGLGEQGLYRKLDAMGEVPAQDHRDFVGRLGLTLGVLALGILGAHLAGWDFDRMPQLRMEARRGALTLHIAAVLAGVWALAHISHPAGEVKHAFKLMFSRRMTPQQRDEVGPMARQFAANSLIFGAIGSITWIGLHAPGIPRGLVNQGSFFMGLTPLLAGLIWSFYFRWRGRGLNTIRSKGNLVQRRFLAYIDKPKPPRGFVVYVLAWSPFVIGAFASLIHLIVHALA